MSLGNADSAFMSVSSISSSSTYQSSLVSLLGESDSSPDSGSSVSSLLGMASSGQDAVTVDLSSYAQAASTGNGTAKGQALAQLKSDLASEKASLLSSLSAGSTSSLGNDVGDQLLSTLYPGSSLSNLGSTGTTLDVSA